MKQTTRNNGCSSFPTNSIDCGCRLPGGEIRFEKSITLPITLAGWFYYSRSRREGKPVNESSCVLLETKKNVSRIGAFGSANTIQPHGRRLGIGLLDKL